ncbi:oligopeptidase B [Undibacterium terreum]|uniref:Oligopeptidase B n=2 Tax=Undibacterium terreum TaxID=1224302 RepID=A0A916UF17_9BURK|nr:oligopeptidase B [Undibacterium terreum]
MLLLTSHCYAADAATPTMPDAPVAAKRPKVDTNFGDRRVDDYFWLREKSNPEVISYLEAENAYAEKALEPTKSLQDKLYKEMLGRIQETDVSAPYRNGKYYYYSRTEAGKQYNILCRKLIQADGTYEASPEEITLDVNQLAEGKKFMSVDAAIISPDGNYLAYATDGTGFRQYVLQVKDLRTGKLVLENRERITSIAWTRDSKNLFYTTEDAVTKRSNQLHLAAINQGQNQAKDKLVYEEKDELFHIDVALDRSKEYIFLSIASSTTTETRFVHADKPASPWQIVLPRKKDQEYSVDYQGGSFYIRINDTGRNFRVIRTPTEKIARTDKRNWHEVVAHRSDVMLEHIDLFKNYLVVHERDKGLQQLAITELSSKKQHRIAFPEAVYSLAGGKNLEWDTKTLTYSYQSFTTPFSVYEYDMGKQAGKLIKRRAVLGGFNPDDYTSERRFTKASDGKMIPVSIVYKKGVKLDGSAPLSLNAYGSYGFPYPISFSSNRLSLLDRGVVFAVAHIRGGGDLGKAWYDDGKMLKKKNTFTDFITAAEFLINEKFTSSDRLAIEGGSAGGLLMGAVTNMRPDLFKLVISHVPFVDVVNTMLDASLPLTVGEYEEWGNPNEKPYYDYIKSYSPYDNLAAKAYPTILVKTSLNDSQVMYWEPAKYVAKLRSLKTDKNPLLLVTNMGAGHGGASGRYDALKENALDYAFLLTTLGIKE